MIFKGKFKALKLIGISGHARSYSALLNVDCSKQTYEPGWLINDNGSIKGHILWIDHTSVRLASFWNSWP